jgi:hypothetical protein
MWLALHRQCFKTVIHRTKRGQAKIDQELPLTIASTRFSELFVRASDVKCCVTRPLSQNHYVCHILLADRNTMSYTISKEINIYGPLFESVLLTIILYNFGYLQYFATIVGQIEQIMLIWHLAS